MKAQLLKYFKLLLDLVMAVTFALLFNNRILGGQTFHEVAGTLFGVAFVLHMALNWRWLWGTTRQLFSRHLPWRTRVSYLVNVLLLASLLSIMVTGLLSSRVVFAGLFVTSNAFTGLHVASSYAALAFVGLHVGLSWHRVPPMLVKPARLQSARTVVWTARMLAVALLLAGAFAILSTNYVTRAASITTAISSVGRGGAGELWFGEAGTAPSEGVDDEAATAARDTTAAGYPSSFEAWGSARVGEHEGDSEGVRGGDSDSDSDSESDDWSDGGSSALWTTLLTNLGILSAFAVAAYYFDRFVLRQRVKPRRPQPRASLVRTQ